MSFVKSGGNYEVGSFLFFSVGHLPSKGLRKPGRRHPVSAHDPLFLDKFRGRDNDRKVTNLVSLNLI